MKLVWFSIVILIVGFGLFWKREPRNASGDPPVSEATVTATRIPTPVGIPSPSPPTPSPVPIAKPPVVDELTPRLEKIAELSRFTLPTQATRDQLIQTLSAPELHKDLGRILEAGDRLEYDVSQEKERMNAVSVLGLILKHKEVSHRDEALRWIRQRILAVDFHSMKDVRVKQSVYGDITELLMILKQYDPESYEDLAQRIGEMKSKVLKTALAASR
ncbi:hypothetical protein [Oligoflexus tunisiensis]|uniref:hypothetical protein n=1 Tax=Oligoflexus tunisiensis TaxID=708132 RepID=UPI00114CBE42|nr:hypothetical protein [Oligoflexus tunisiensis]